jgi:hypothetical protein
MKGMMKKPKAKKPSGKVQMVGAKTTKKVKAPKPYAPVKGR